MDNYAITYFHWLTARIFIFQSVYTLNKQDTTCIRVNFSCIPTVRLSLKRKKARPDIHHWWYDFREKCVRHSRFAYLASLALSSSSLALLMCWAVWLTMPSTLVRLERLSFICMTILSKVVLLTGRVIDRTCRATFSMLSGSAPSSEQMQEQTANETSGH